MQEWIGVLRFRNIASDTATTGRDAVRLALRCPDYEFVLIDMVTQGPPAEEIVQELHQDYRTASLRIGLVARAGLLKRAERIAEQDPLTIAFSQPIDGEAARWQFGMLMERTPREFVGYSERLDLAVRALDCLAKLASASGKLYDIRRAEDAALAGLLQPRLSRSCPGGAGLSRYAKEPAGPGRARQPFRRPVEGPPGRGDGVWFQRRAGFGLLLDREAIQLQYARYNKSATQDLPTQQVLGSILSTIESRAAPSILAAARKGAALQKPLPRKPPPPPKPMDLKD